MLASRIMAITNRLSKRFNDAPKAGETTLAGIPVTIPKKGSPVEFISAMRLHAARTLCAIQAQAVRIPCSLHAFTVLTLWYRPASSFLFGLKKWL